MGLIKNKKCKNCRMLFPPDPRNAKRQKFCFKPECRKASKKDSQRRWLNKPKNRDYFRSSENVIRVQEWRKANPGYWKKSNIALQDLLIAQPPEKTDDTIKPANIALQDLLTEQPAVLIGLISNITGTALQDDIAKTLLRLRQLGQDILNPLPRTKGGRYDCQTPHHQKSHPKNSQAIQLGRSPTGP